MFLQPPLTVVFSWPAPNTINPATRVPATLAVICSMIALATIAVSLRIFSRLQVSKTFGTDDWLILGAFATFIVYNGLILQDVRYGVGLHVWDYLVHPQWIEPALKLSLASSPVFVMSLCLTKLSILFFYGRVIFTPQAASERMVKVLKITTWVVAIWGIIFFFLKIVQCIPVHVYWDHSFILDTNRKSCSTFALFAFAYTDIPLDLAIIILPIKPIVSLQMDFSKKLQVIGLFSVGSLSLIAGALRIMPIINTTRTYDLTWETATLFMFSVVELSVAICCASVPAIRVMFQSLATKKAKYIPSTSDSSNSGHSHRRHIREPSECSTIELALVEEEHHKDKVAVGVDQASVNIGNMV